MNADQIAHLEGLQLDELRRKMLARAYKLILSSTWCDAVNSGTETDGKSDSDHIARLTEAGATPSIAGLSVDSGEKRMP